MSPIVWLASYPKSGNTWLRAFLTNFQSAGGSPTDINRLIGVDAAARHLFDNVLGVESSDMTYSEIERYRPSLYRQIASGASELVFLKVHDAYTRVWNTEPLIPADASKGAIYIVRNPLDVAISLAHHSGLTLDASIDVMADDGFAFSSSQQRLNNNLKQRLMSWSGHVLSWLDQDAIPVHLMRYEDTQRDPLKAFSDVLKFVGVNTDIDRICRAIDFSSFAVLQEQERVSGFKERPPNAHLFFRGGRTGEWREMLTSEQAARVVTHHNVVMRRLGYLSEDGIVE